jgi:hypothetical protein
MAEVTIISTDLPEELDPPDNPGEEATEEAPYGYKADGSPRKRPGRKPGSGGGGGSKSLASMREPLIQRLVEYIGGPIMLISPIGAAVWEERVEKTADSILILAARSPRWRKWVERLIAGSAGGDLGLTFVGVGTGILVDTERLSPEGRLQHYFGIDRIYEDLYGAYVASQANGDNARGLYAEVSEDGN